MTGRIREILDNYQSESSGTLANLARLLNHGALAGTGRMVILPVDQGFEHGPARSFAPNPAGYDPRYHFELAIEAGCSAYAAPLGFLEAGAAEFAVSNPSVEPAIRAVVAELVKPLESLERLLEPAKIPQCASEHLPRAGIVRAPHGCFFKAAQSVIQVSSLKSVESALIDFGKGARRVRLWA